MVGDISPFVCNFLLLYMLGACWAPEGKGRGREKKRKKRARVYLLMTREEQQPHQCACNSSLAAYGKGIPPPTQRR